MTTSCLCFVNCVLFIVMYVLVYDPISTNNNVTNVLLIYMICICWVLVGGGSKQSATFKMTGTSYNQPCSKVPTYICDRICENVHSSHKDFNSFF